MPPKTGDYRIILASASPRRSELLRQIGVEFTVLPAAIDETVQEGETPPVYARRMAAEKAEVGWQNAAQDAAERPHLAIGADTAVVARENILGKPDDAADARRMLKMLSGSTHTVLSAVAVTDGERMAEHCSATEVVFRALGDDEIDRYWATGEPADKAGAYAIQGLGALFVKELSGSYTGVVGLPLYETAELLAEFGCGCGLTRK